MPGTGRVFLKVVDQFFSMLDILDDEEDAHREGEESNKADADLKTEAFVKLCLAHRHFIRSSPAVRRRKVLLKPSRSAGGREEQHERVKNTTINTNNPHFVN